MKDIFYFTLGVFVGAMAALFLAPKSGQELRGDLQQRTSMDLERLQRTYEQSLKDINSKLEQVQTQLKKNTATVDTVLEEVEKAEAA